ncbi:hypothetical protein [Mycolicibacterium tokaiense]|uniref:Copper chaperone PCu(A)C n=1 Tax=Mycolicibacterium tokaiense TaxID=39695 RepID=A0A378TIX6_9MYCO|nr:hypothetical protein [Mycolicibacterium tokaiense]BBY84736.1 hypothetical protein MTOK_05180 [Mycolicibacterium tokaiense]STZ60758.1 Uncharacterised protein [Mycolicibacterium tokaiense]
MSRIRDATSVACGVGLAAVISGCGTDADVESSNRGSGSDTAQTSVLNAYIVPAHLAAQCALQVDAGGVLVFTVTNTREDSADRLEAVAVADGDAQSLATPIEIPAAGSVGFGEPVDGAIARAPLTLETIDPQLEAGMSTDVTFRFTEAGDIAVRTPVEACPTQSVS